MIHESARAFAHPIALGGARPSDGRALRAEPAAYARETDGLPALRPAGPGLPSDLAALERAGLPPGPVHAALVEARRIGAEPFDVLLASGAFDETFLIETFARALGLDVAGPEDAAAGPIDADTFELACASGYLASLTADGRPRFVIAARGPAIRRLAASRRGRPRTRSFAIAGPRAFLDLASARAGGGLSARAAEGPAATVPELSVVGGMPRVGRGAQAGVLLIAALVVAAAIFAPGVWATLLLLGGLVFATSNGFRLMLALTPPAEAPRRLWSDDASLPVYTVMAALHREAAVVPSLLDAIERLDYPALGSNGTTTPRASTAATR